MFHREKKQERERETSVCRDMTAFAVICEEKKKIIGLLYHTTSPLSLSLWPIMMMMYAHAVNKQNSNKME
jgi:hypothetical protein